MHVNGIAIIEKLAKDQVKELCGGNADCAAKASITWSDALERTPRGANRQAVEAGLLKELADAAIETLDHAVGLCSCGSDQSWK